MRKLLTMILLVVSTMIHAEEINIVWGFNLGSTQANSVRAIILEANASQSKYKFVLDNKTGGGGSIAANYVARNNNSILAMSSSFFIRPVYETQGIHDINEFQPVLVQAVGSPIVVVSKRFKSFTEFKNSTNVSTGIAGYGTISHLVATQVNTDTKNMTMIPFKSSIDAGVAAAGGHVDVTMAFYTDVKPFIDNGSVNVLAYTGMRQIEGLPFVTFEKLGYPKLNNLTANYGMYVSATMQVNKVKELHEILSASNRKLSVIDTYKVDNLNPVQYSHQKTVEWFDQEKIYWKKQVNSVKNND